MSGVAKHLVIVGPVALGVLLGASSHGVGKTYVPFWDGASGYSGGITVG